MARHFGDVTTREAASLDAWIVDWLRVHNVAGSIAGEYSLYRAVQDEHAKARASWPHGPAVSVVTIIHKK